MMHEVVASGIFPSTLQWTLVTFLEQTSGILVRQLALNYVVVDIHCRQDRITL